MVNIKGKTLSGIFSDLLKRIVCSSESSFALFIGILGLTFAYRIQLTKSLFTNSVRPFDVNPACHPIWFVLAYFPYDLSLSLACVLLSWLLSGAHFSIKQSKAFAILKISGFVFSHIILIILPLVHGAHIRLLFDAQTGLNYSMVMEVLLNVSFFELFKFVRLRDCIFLLFPIGLFWLVFLSPRSSKIWMGGVQIASLIILSSISVFAANYKSTHVPAEIRLNPALFLLSDVAENAIFKRSAESRNIKRIDANDSDIHLAGSMYTHQMMPVTILPPKTPYQWNIIFFIMESVGTRYIFDTSYGNPMPMPFLHGIAKESWHLKNHYTTSNISTKAIFSLLSGLYDSFSRKAFGIRPDSCVPSIHNFLAEGYDSFLVTPSPITWYFPTAFVRNSGLLEMHHYENLNFRIKEEFHSVGRYIGRDEIQTVDFFIQRLNKAREPFLGIYVSFAAHFPYFDYGADYRIMEEDGRLISRYYNNLNLLDHMIKWVFDNLQNRGLLDRTILVIVGDHGQAFGQHHPDNYMHHRYSYNENLQTPAIIYQPKLFKPRAIELPTSHVDILPTLLDAMKIPHNPVLFGGESLFHHKLKRKYIFFYGHEECISSLDTNQIKVQYSLKKNRCWAFDLKLDPDEKNPLDCSSYTLQLEVLHKFVSDHDSSLVKYNARMREKKRVSETQAPVAMEINYLGE